MYLLMQSLHLCGADVTLYLCVASFTSVFSFVLLLVSVSVGFLSFVSIVMFLAGTGIIHNIIISHK